MPPANRGQPAAGATPIATVTVTTAAAAETQAAAPAGAAAGLAAGRGEWLLIGALALIWSSSFGMIKIGVESIPPISLAFGRMAIGGLLLAAVALWQRDRLPTAPRDWLGALAVGLFGNALPFSLIGWGELHVDSGLAAIFMGAMPIVVLLMAHLFTHDERLTGGRALGVGCGFAGLIMLVGWQALEGIGEALWAQLALFAAACCYATSTMVVRRVVRHRGTSMAALATLAGALLLAPLALWLEAPLDSSPTSASLWALLGLGLLPTALATLIYFRLLGRIGVNVFAQVNYLIPILGVLWGALLLGEQPGWRELIALALILGGMAIVNREARR